jgi:hypothetical protein
MNDPEHICHRCFLTVHIKENTYYCLLCMKFYYLRRRLICSACFKEGCNEHPGAAQSSFVETYKLPDDVDVPGLR